MPDWHGVRMQRMRDDIALAGALVLIWKGGQGVKRTPPARGRAGQRDGRLEGLLAVGRFPVGGDIQAGAFIFLGDAEAAAQDLGHVIGDDGDHAGPDDG